MANEEEIQLRSLLKSDKRPLAQLDNKKNLGQYSYFPYPNNEKLRRTNLQEQIKKHKLRW